MDGDSLRTLAMIARVFCWIVAGLAAMAALMTFGWLASYYASTGNQTFLLGAGLVNFACWIAFLVSTVPVLLWIYRAHANLAAAGLHGLAHSPGWIVASYFVPLANFVVPLLGMRELHNRSAGERKTSPIRASRWRRAGGPATLRRCWCCWWSPYRARWTRCRVST